MDSKKIQLFLLPFAGGNSVSFNQLIGLLDNHIEATCVEYSGRLSRHKEIFITEYEDFLNDIANYINARRSDLPISILGYSLGSALTFDLITKKMIKGKVEHCFICAHGDLRDRSISQKYHELSDTEFMQKMINLGGFDQRILNNKRFLEIYMKPVKMDYVIWSKYKYEDKGIKIPCDVTVMYSSRAPLSASVHGWADLTEKNIDFYELGDNHFFIKQHYEEMAEIINSHLRKYNI